MGTKFSPGINQWDSHLLNTRTEIGLKSILDGVGISDGRDMWRVYGWGTAQKGKRAGKKQGERRAEGEQDLLCSFYCSFSSVWTWFFFSPVSKLCDKLGNSLETLKSLLMISYTWWVTIIQVSSERGPETSAELPSAHHKQLQGNLAAKYAWIHSVIVEVKWAQRIQFSRPSFPQQTDTEW